MCHPQSKLALVGVNALPSFVFWCARDPERRCTGLRNEVARTRNFRKVWSSDRWTQVPAFLL